MRPKRSYPQTLGHRQIAMLVIERPIREYEIVHHIDGDDTNDDPDNLLVMPNSTHLLIHGKKIAPRWMRDAFAWLTPPHTRPRYLSDCEKLNARYFPDWMNRNPWAFAWLYNEPTIIEFPDGTKQLLR